MSEARVGFDPPNGRKKEHKGVTWISHCGAWWSALAWKDLDASHMVARDGFNCGACGSLLVSEEQREVTVRAEKAGHFKNALRDDLHGEFIPFVMENGRDLEPAPIVAPGAEVKLVSRLYEPFRASHLSFAADAVGRFTILNLRTGREPLIAGPIPADYFAVRIPDDAALPIDRGGPLIHEAVLMTTFPAQIHLRNDGKSSLRATCGLYGKPIDASEWMKIIA